MVVLDEDIAEFSLNIFFMFQLAWKPIKDTQTLL